MTPHALKSALAEKRLTVGSWLALADPFVAEIMARQGGFDWLAVDMEHGAAGWTDQARLIQTVDLCGLAALVRVAANDPVHIQRALDAGAAGVIVPRINSAEAARAAVAAAHYPPRGSRGVGLFRAQGHGAGFEAYLSRAAAETVVIVQIEHIDAVAALPAILAVEGVDGFLVGPYDLSASMGRPGAFDDPEVAAALDALAGPLRDHLKPGGFHVVHPDPAALARRMEQGARLLAYGMDTTLLGHALAGGRAALDEARAGHG